MSRELVTHKQRIQSVRETLEKYQGQMAKALPRAMTAERFARVALTEIARNPMLLEASGESLIACMLQSAQLGLEIGSALGWAYLVPFRNQKKGVVECQFIPGYKGLAQLAWRTGQLASFNMRAVYSCDRFEWQQGTKEDIDHRPANERPKDAQLTHAYAVAFVKGGGVPNFVVLTRQEIDAIRQRAKAKEFSPWVSDFEAMAKKSAAKRVCKLLPATPALARAVVLDDAAEDDRDQGIELDERLASTPEPGSDDEEKALLADLERREKAGR